MVEESASDWSITGRKIGTIFIKSAKKVDKRDLHKVKRGCDKVRERIEEG